MKKPGIEQTITLLTGKYGLHECQPNGRPLDELIRTILSQNTSDTNSGRAFDSLRSAFRNWEDLIDARESLIADSIKVGGLGQIKSKRIKQVIGEIKQKRGDLDLDFLGDLSIDDARNWLKQLPGVGDKTANCVLLFSMCRPALPVDTHIFRVSKRLGLVDPRASVEKAHVLLEVLVPPDRVYRFHVLMIEHGRRICKAQRPRCTECVLGKICPSYEVFVGSGTNRSAKKQEKT